MALLDDRLLLQVQDRDKTRAAANAEAETSAALSEKAMQQVNVNICLWSHRTCQTPDLVDKGSFSHLECEHVFVVALYMSNSRLG